MGCSTKAIRPAHTCQHACMATKMSISTCTSLEAGHHQLVSRRDYERHNGSRGEHRDGPQVELRPDTVT